jgi:hypothetical protein
MKIEIDQLTDLVDDGCACIFFFSDSNVGSDLAHQVLREVDEHLRLAGGGVVRKFRVIKEHNLPSPSHTNSSTEVNKLHKMIEGILRGSGWKGKVKIVLEETVVKETVIE